MVNQDKRIEEQIKRFSNVNSLIRFHVIEIIVIQKEGQRVLLMILDCMSFRSNDVDDDYHWKRKKNIKTLHFHD